MHDSCIERDLWLKITWNDDNRRKELLKFSLALALCTYWVAYVLLIAFCPWCSATEYCSFPSRCHDDGEKFPIAGSREFHSKVKENSDNNNLEWIFYGLQWENAMNFIRDGVTIYGIWSYWALKPFVCRYPIFKHLIVEKIHSIFLLETCMTWKYIGSTLKVIIKKNCSCESKCFVFHIWTALLVQN